MRALFNKHKRYILLVLLAIFILLSFNQALADVFVITSHTGLQDTDGNYVYLNQGIGAEFCSPIGAVLRAPVGSLAHQSRGKQESGGGRDEEPNESGEHGLFFLGLGSVGRWGIRSGESRAGCGLTQDQEPWEEAQIPLGSPPALSSISRKRSRLSRRLT